MPDEQNESIEAMKASGAGEDLMFPYLNARLLGRDWDGNMQKLINVLNSDDFPVPQGPKELQASQNLFWLKAGAEREMWPNKQRYKNSDEDLISRLERERTTIGLWGSEQTSPIYHHFVITGQAATYINSKNEALKAAIVQNLASFFWYAKTMGLYEKPHGLIGQRGSGHNFTAHGFPDLHFFMRYFLGGRPLRYKQAGGWKNFLKDSGWVFGSLKGGRTYDLMKLVFDVLVSPGFVFVGVAVPIHFFSDGSHYMEKGTNGNTPELGAYVNWSTPAYLPVNERIRVRQRASKGEYRHVVEQGRVVFEYRGIYTGLEGSSGDPQWRVLSTPASELQTLVVSLHDHTGWQPVVPAVHDPFIPTVPDAQKPPRKKPWWRRIFS